jgi:two-component system response regulator PilR (NtrC family)
MASSHPSGRLLVIEDEPALRKMLTSLFQHEGHSVTAAASFAEGSEAIRSVPEPYALVLTDLMLPGGSGFDLLSMARERSARTEVIVITALTTIETAIEAMKRGAYDFVTKPFATAELRALARKALEKHAIVVENERLRAQLARERPRDLLGHSEATKRVFELVQRVAKTKSTVLITGESGTGKERVARAIHDLSDRADKPFVVVNCAALPPTLMESELFGHGKGAFTGAQGERAGIFREAEGGTVLLDEVGEIDAALQVKLLRVLQERKVRGVGMAAETSIDVRVLSATNRNVEDDVKTGKFRQDLYYRLNVIRIEVPPLRERREDIAELAEAFLRRFSAEHDKETRGFSPDAVRALLGYSFPGNVRELENAVERAVTLAISPLIGLGDLPQEIGGAAAQSTPLLLDVPDEGCSLDEVLAEVERRLVVQALEKCGGVRTSAAKLLRITRRSLHYRLEKLALAEDSEPSGEAGAEAGEAEPERR